MRIVQSIEVLREELAQQGTIKGLQDPEVIRISQKLEEFINAYYRLPRPEMYGSRIKLILNNKSEPVQVAGFCI